MQVSVEMKALRREADKLAIPYSADTTADNLRELITTRQRRLTMQSQQVEQRGGNSEQPECFGEFWDNTPGEEPGPNKCPGCKFSEPCLEQFTNVTLVQIQGQLGSRASMAALVNATGVSEKAIVFVLEHRAKRNGGQPRAVTPPPMPPDSAPRPRKAGASVRRVEAPASVSEDRVTNPTAKARAGGSHPRKMEKRWRRERQRLPELREYRAGDKLTVTYKGVKHQVRLLDIGYRYRGKTYATLYEVSGEITGWRNYAKQVRRDENGKAKRPSGSRAMAAWSARRLFFKESAAG